MARSLSTHLLLVTLAALWLAGCSTGGELLLFKNRESAYQLAGTAPELKLPKDLDGSRLQPLMVVPPLSRTAVVASVLDPINPKPQSLNNTSEEQYIKIQKLGDRHWLVIGESPAIVWPRVKQFLVDNRMTLVSDEPGSGLLETDWVPLDGLGEDDLRRSLRKAAQGDLSRPAKLFVRVEPGLRDGTSEVHLRQINDVLIRTRWPEKSALPAAEETLLTTVGEYLAADAVGPAISLRAQRIAGESKSILEKDDSGKPRLVLRLDYDRAWATVGQAMAKAELNVTDLNRSTGMFYVQVSEADLEMEKPGFVGRLFSGSGAARKVTLHMQALRNPSATAAGGSDNAAPPEEQYALTVQPEANATLPEAFAERLLTVEKANAAIRLGFREGKAVQVRLREQPVFACERNRW